jgi:hypothetical protein
MLVHIRVLANKGANVVNITTIKMPHSPDFENTRASTLRRCREQGSYETSNQMSIIYLFAMDANKAKDKENGVQYLVVDLPTYACSVLCSCATKETSRSDHARAQLESPYLARLTDC